MFAMLCNDYLYSEHFHHLKRKILLSDHFQFPPSPQPLATTNLLSVHIGFANSCSFTAVESYNTWPLALHCHPRGSPVKGDSHALSQTRSLQFREAVTCQGRWPSRGYRPWSMHLPEPFLQEFLFVFSFLFLSFFFFCPPPHGL